MNLKANAKRFKEETRIKSDQLALEKLKAGVITKKECRKMMGMDSEPSDEEQSHRKKRRKSSPPPDSDDEMDELEDDDFDGDDGGNGMHRGGTSSRDSDDGEDDAFEAQTLYN